MPAREIKSNDIHLLFFISLHNNDITNFNYSLNWLFENTSYIYHTDTYISGLKICVKEQKKPIFDVFINFLRIRYRDNTPNLVFLLGHGIKATEKTSTYYLINLLNLAEEHLTKDEIIVRFLQPLKILEWALNCKNIPNAHYLIKNYHLKITKMYPYILTYNDYPFYVANIGGMLINNAIYEKHPKLFI